MHAFEDDASGTDDDNQQESQEFTPTHRFIVNCCSSPSDYESAMQNMYFHVQVLELALRITSLTVPIVRPY
jgi:hypothetical protein